MEDFDGTFAYKSYRGFPLGGFAGIVTDSPMSIEDRCDLAADMIDAIVDGDIGALRMFREKHPRNWRFLHSLIVKPHRSGFFRITSDPHPMAVEYIGQVASDQSKVTEPAPRERTL